MSCEMLTPYVNNYRFGDYLHLIYPKCIEIKILLTLKNTASFLDLHLEIGYGKILKPKLYDKHYPFSRIFLRSST
jgi:hypothetical protein